MPDFSKTFQDLFNAVPADGCDYVRKLIVETEQAISAVESRLDEQRIRDIAELCRKLVLVTPRGKEGVIELNRLDQTYRSRNDPRCHAAAMAANLILADDARTRGDGDSLMASFAVATLQVEIETFLERHGVAAWGVPYTDIPNFEKIRSPAGKS